MDVVPEPEMCAHLRQQAMLSRHLAALSKDAGTARHLQAIASEWERVVAAFEAEAPAD